MATLSQEEIDQLVLGVVREHEGNNGIELSTVFGDDFGQLRVDETGRGGFFGPIRTAVEKAGCKLHLFSTQHCRSAKTVGDIAKALFKDLNG